MSDGTDETGWSSRDTAVLDARRNCTEVMGADFDGREGVDFLVHERASGPSWTRFHTELLPHILEAQARQVAERTEIERRNAAMRESIAFDQANRVKSQPYATRSGAIRAAKARCKAINGRSYEAAEGPDYIIDMETEAGGWRTKYYYRLSPSMIEMLMQSGAAAQPAL